MLGTHERPRELEAIAEAMERTRGCLLIGPAGVGKSAVASTAAGAMASTHHVVRVRATTGAAELPLGAFAALLGPGEQGLTPPVAEARSAILSEAAGRPILLSVDDIDLLDDASVVLVHQLVSLSEASLLATCRSGQILPTEVLDLLQRGEIRQVPIAALDRTATATMAAHLIGRPLNDDSLHRLLAATQGNALSIRVLLAGAMENGELVDSDDGVDLVRLPVQAPAVVDMVRQRLGFLDDAQRAALTAVAFAEPCGPADVASVADDAMLGFLEEAELITATIDRARLVIHLAHPLFGEVLRSSTPVLQRRRILGVLATDLAATGARRRSDKIRLARLGLDGGISVPREVTLDAIAMCHVTGDMLLAERLGRAEFVRSKEFKVGLGLTQALMALGDADEHDRALDELRSIASTTGERLAVAFQDSQSAYWLRGDQETSMRIIDAALEANPDDAVKGPVTRQDLLARRALMFATSGLSAPAWEGYRSLGEFTAGTARILALLTEAIAASLDGHPQSAIDALDRGRAAFAALGPAGTAIWVRRLVSNRVLAHGVAGDLDNWESDTSRFLEHAVDGQQLAYGYMLRAHAFALRGRPSLGRPLIDAAQRWWSQAGNGGGGLPRRYVLATAVHLYGTAGDVAKCRAALNEFDADTHDSRLLDHYADVGRARMLVADNRPEDARRSLRTAILHYAERGDRPGEMNCAYELVRLDAAEEVFARMTEIASVSASPLFDAQALHARGAAAYDPDLLEQAAEEFATRGFAAAAAAAAAHAAEAARRAGNQRRATAALVRVQELRALCDDDMPIAATQNSDAGPIALTRREREVGVLAAQGLGNREIAERLFISRRTCENHLARVFEKFGISSRAELVRVFESAVTRVSA